MARRGKTRNFKPGNTLRGFFAVVLSMIAFIGVLYALTAAIGIALG